MNNVITASGMGTLISCPRKYFWGNECGLTKSTSGLALRFGSAWHRGMEARWNGAAYEDALAIAAPEGIELDDYSLSTLAAMLAGYYDHYGQCETVAKLYPEIQFDFPLIDEFRMQGKIDGIGETKDGQLCLVESKTTSDQVDPASDYWMRLNFNVQVYQYIDAARKLGWDISKAIYDVARKPMIRPSKVTKLDELGLKQVIGRDGKRVFIRNDKKKTLSPKQTVTAADGEMLLTSIETPDQFSTRLWEDTVYRPEFYFARKEVPILDNVFEQFENHRLACVRMIQSFRANERYGAAEVAQYARDCEAWPRNITETTCSFCPFKSFCLQNITIDINQPPEGYEIKPFNQELDPNYDATQIPTT